MTFPHVLRAASGGFLALSLLASPANAGHAKLRMRGVAGGAPADLTVTLRPNQTAFVDLSSILASAPDNDFVTSVSGPVTLKVWSEADQTAGQTTTWVKANLRTYLVAAETGGATGANVGHWDLTYRTGAGETGGLVTKRVRFDVADYGSTIPYTIGSRNRAGYGGWCKVGELPGLVANKSITNQSTPDAFKFFNGTAASNVPTAGTSCLAWNGTYASLTKSPVASPTTGAGAYWVDITDSVLGLTWRIVWTVNADELNFAPNTSDTANGQQMVTGLFNGGGTTYCGMRAILESGTYLGGVNIKVTNTTPDPLLGTACPTTPYATGWDPRGDRDWNPGWLKLYGREPISATTGAKVGVFATGAGTLNAELTTCGCFYYEISNIEGSFFFNRTNKPTPGYEWVAVHHTRAPQLNLNAGKDYSRYLFVRSNIIDATGLVGVGSLQLAARDAQGWNNRFKGTDADVINATVYDETCGSDRSWIGFNYSTHKYMKANNHPDAFQWRFELIGATDNAPLYNAAAEDTEFCLAKVVGNTWTRGSGYKLLSGDIGSVGFGGAVVGAGDVDKHVETSHGLFMLAGQRNGTYTDGANGDARTPVKHRMIVVGNSFNDLSFHGLELPRLADNSVIRHNLISPSFGVIAGGLTGTGYAYKGPFNFGSQTGAPFLNAFVGGVNSTIKVERNIFAAGATTNITVLPSTAISDPAATQSGNDYTPLSTASITDAAAAWVDPFNQDQETYLKDYLAHWAPKPGGRYDVVGGIGPIVPDRTKLDLRRGWVADSLLVP